IEFAHLVTVVLKPAAPFLRAWRAWDVLRNEHIGQATMLRAVHASRKFAGAWLPHVRRRRAAELRRSPQPEHAITADDHGSTTFSSAIAAGVDGPACASTSNDGS